MGWRFTDWDAAAAETELLNMEGLHWEGSGVRRSGPPVYSFGPVAPSIGINTASTRSDFAVFFFSKQFDIVID